MSGGAQYYGSPATAHVAEKVMRRVEIAKVARNLQDCLAFASFKAQNGWQNRTLRSIEPEVAEKLKRKRPFATVDMLSDSSPNDSDGNSHSSFSSTQTITQKLLQSGRGSHADSVMEDSFQVPQQRKRVRSSSSALQTTLASNASWKQDRQLAQSSPVLRRTQIADAPPSFVADAPPIPDSSDASSPSFNLQTTSDDEEDLPMHSFQEQRPSSVISSSPPRTPPPSRRAHNASTKQGGADLLLHFAYSPSRSPAVNIANEAPSTPPSQQTHLPSSVMHTPGNSLGLFNGALQTPSQSFNFADFVNVTPSPSQVPWGGRTPGLTKTPRAARRGLNFDQLAPPSGSPSMQRKAPTSQGLALQLGEALVPRKTQL